MRLANFSKEGRGWVIEEFWWFCCFRPGYSTEGASSQVKGLYGEWWWHDNWDCPIISPCCPTIHFRVFKGHSNSWNKCTMHSECTLGCDIKDLTSPSSSDWLLSPPVHHLLFNYILGPWWSVFYWISGLLVSIVAIVLCRLAHSWMQGYHHMPALTARLFSSNTFCRMKSFQCKKAWKRMVSC